MDFLHCLDLDTLEKILMYLEEPSDIVRVSAVSQSWRDFVIANGLCKKLCLRKFPQLSRAACVTELNKCGAKEPVEVGSSHSMKWESLAREHRVYATLSRVCTSFPVKDCISEAISASSTDNYPEESINNTLHPKDIVLRTASYWSSKGKSNPAVPETLIYKLVSELCVITEINLRPFQAYFQLGLPIYSANSVRFRMGHLKRPKDFKDLGSSVCDGELPYPADDMFQWTYTSPEFPMAQEKRLQKFTLPEPVLCIGGILQIELLGRVQRQEMDGLFYICMSYVQVRGCSLSPAFGVEILEPSGTFVLKKDMQGKFHTQPSLPETEAQEISDDHLQRCFRYLLHFVNTLQGNAVQVIDEYDLGEEEDEGVDEEGEEYYLL